MGREMLNRWAASLPDRKVIEGFWEWLMERCEKLSDENGGGSVYFDDINLKQMLDEYHEILTDQLELERRALVLDGEESE